MCNLGITYLLFIIYNNINISPRQNVRSIIRIHPVKLKNIDDFRQPSFSKQLRRCMRAG